MAQLQTDEARAEAEVKKATDDLHIFYDSLKEFTPGSEGYKSTEKEFIRRQTELQMRTKGLKDEFHDPRGGHL